jgi:hypothetical protein
MQWRQGGTNQNAFADWLGGVLVFVVFAEFNDFIFDNDNDQYN